MSGEICADNRFEIIAAYKKKLVEATNIQASPDEMAVIDNILFRFWQMGWLPPIPHGRLIDADVLEDSFEPSDFWNHDAEDNCFAAVCIVHSAPTVIPASESKERPAFLPTYELTPRKTCGPDQEG